MGRRQSPRSRLQILLILALSLASLSMASLVAAQEADTGAIVKDSGALKLEHLYPMFLMLVMAFLVWRYMVPSALSSLQVAFEIDAGLMEAHRLTRRRGDAREL